MNSVTPGEEITQSAEYKEYRALVDKIFKRNVQIVEEVAESTSVDSKTAQSILNNDGGGGYAPHTREQIEMMVRERSKHVNRSVPDKLAELRRQLNDPKLFDATTASGLTEDVDLSLLPELPDHVIGEIADESVDRIRERLHEKAQALSDLALSEQELREWSGILNPRGTADDKIAALEVLANEYRLKALREGDLRKETALRNIAETAELKQT